MLPHRSSRPVWARRVALLVACAMLAAGVAVAQGPRTDRPTVSTGPQWSELRPQEREALKPLQTEWPGIEAQRKQKWLEIAGRFSSMSKEEQERVSARMSQWARMTPSERGQARLNFQETRQLPAAERQARWDAYQALPADQKRQLAERSRATPAPLSVPATPQRGNSTSTRLGATDPAKSNIVPNPPPDALRRPVAPTVVQAQPGATTPLMTRRPVPPSHQQPGLPKIAATHGFVDDATLLPKRGPQGAAVRSTPASEPDSRPRR